MSEGHPRLEEIHELIDGRLDAEARRRIEQHLQECGTCREEWNRIASAREILRSTLTDAEEVPPQVRHRVAAALEKENKRRGARRWLVAASLAAAAVLAIAVTLLLRRPAVDFASEAVRDFSAISAGTAPLQLQTSNPAQLETWFDRQLGFHSRVFDLGMMRYRLLGGRIDELGSRRSALFVYRHDDGALVICEMYEGVTADLPAGAERRHNNGIDFFVFERDGTTAVFWQEGSVVCVLASRRNREDLIALAYAKAMRAV